MKLVYFLNILLMTSCQGCTLIQSVNKDEGHCCSPITERVDRDTLHFENLGKLSKGIIAIEHDVDLKGKVCEIPAGVTLSMKGGRIRNGVLIGNETKLNGKGVFFGRVTIRGSWNVPFISTSMFDDLNYENSLKDVLALSNPNVRNSIFIAKGEYKVKALKNADVCLKLCDNTHLELNGSIMLVPNEFKQYYIIQVKGNKISISGDGSVIGDKDSHFGTEGEWGMGLRFHEASNSSVNGLTIKDCWGDCIYVGGNSKNILIKNCNLDNGRRQGISVTKADNVTVKKCIITNVGGTKPEFAIDVEPNRGDTVDNVLIDEVVARDCQGGFKATKSMDIVDGKPVSKIGTVRIRNCQIFAKRKYPILIKGCEWASVEGCVVSGTNARPLIYALEGGHVEIVNNKVKPDADILSSSKIAVKKIIGRKDINPISIVNQKSQKVNGNTIFEP